MVNKTANKWYKLHGLMGLCTRSKQATFGAVACMQAVRGGQCALLLVDEGASEATLGKYRDVCAYRGVPMAVIPEGLLHSATGKPGVAMAAKAGTLAERMIKLLTDSDRETRSEETANNGGGASVE